MLICKFWRIHADASSTWRHVYFRVWRKDITSANIWTTEDWCCSGIHIIKLLWYHSTLSLFNLESLLLCLLFKCTKVKQLRYSQFDCFVLSTFTHLKIGQHYKCMTLRFQYIAPFQTNRNLRHRHKNRPNLTITYWAGI